MEGEGEMSLRKKRGLLLGGFAVMAMLAASAFAQQPAKPLTDAPVKVVVDQGLAGREGQY